MMKTVSYQWVHLACLVVFATLIAATHVNHGQSLYVGAKWEEKYFGQDKYVKLLNNLYSINKTLK